MISKASIDNIRKQKITKHYYERVVTIFVVYRHWKI